MYKKLMFSFIIFLSTCLNLHCSGNSIHQNKRNLINKFLNEFVDNGIISQEDRLDVNEFLNGSDKKFDGADKIIDVLNKEISMFSKVCVMAGGNCSFEQKLLSELKLANEEIIKKSLEDVNDLQISKKRWSCFTGSLKSYLKNKPKSLKQRIFSLGKYPAYYIYFPFYTIGKHVFKKPILKVTEYISTALFVIFIVAVTKAAVAPDGKSLTAFYSVFNTVAKAGFNLLFATPEDPEKNMYWFDKGFLKVINCFNGLLYKSIGLVF
ncbi:hypothetical protein ACFLYH_02650 [Candidatus Dependentiae bacterium]